MTIISHAMKENTALKRQLKTITIIIYNSRVVIKLTRIFL